MPRPKNQVTWQPEKIDPGRPYLIEIEFKDGRKARILGVLTLTFQEYGDPEGEHENVHARGLFVSGHFIDADNRKTKRVEKFIAFRHIEKYTAEWWPSV